MVLIFCLDIVILFYFSLDIVILLDNTNLFLTSLSLKLHDSRLLTKKT